jgi:hypothetical protein
MRNLKYLLTAAALGGLVALPQPSSASPLSGGLASAGSATSEITDGLVQKVHGYHCGKRKGWYSGYRRWHSHWRACKRRYYDDDDYSSYYRPRRSYDRPYYDDRPAIVLRFGDARRYDY